MLTVGDTTKPLVEWAEELGITRQALEYRLEKWPPEIAVSRDKAKDTPFLKGHQTKRKRGSDHYRAKLNEQRVQEILLAHHNGETTRSLAKRFGVSDGTIVFITKRKTWKHVPFPQPEKE
jgi:Zn-dependent peptidase ImmA (M78 family)